MTPLHGFTLIRDEAIPELNTQARIYRHIKTGAELLALSNDDENKCFGVTFRTPPEDSTGIAHILEHSVLCGSRKYPVKEPFVELLKSSLKTFLNAFTYADKTCYPVASTNLQDFYNLVDVYLDAVFFPRITPEILKQEGWHYELEDKNDPLIYKGVVFNEMKGAYSSPEGVLWRFIQQSLFPDTTYGYSSGGDPKVMPDLTYEQFKRFHTTLYHPSNARIFFYGDDPEEERLRLLDACLSEFEPITPPSQIALQPRFAAPRTFAHTYPADDTSGKKGMVALNWMLDAEQDVERILCMDLLSYILIGNAAAPLRKALIDSGLGEDLTSSGYHDGLLQHTFSVGLKGIDPADEEQVERLILDTLAKLAEEGIDPETVAAALNTFEFSLRENNTGSFPRGLSLMLRSLNTWLYDGDPIAPLRFEQPMANIRAALERGERIFEDRIRQMLLDNPHRTRVLLQPDPTQAEREAEEERVRLDAARATMSDADLERIVAETQALKEMQERADAPEELAKIPTLTLANIERQGKNIPTNVEQIGATTVLQHDLFTNGIVYLSLAFDLKMLPTNLLPYVPLFGRALTEMGTQSEDFVKLLQRIGRETGGVGAGASTATKVGGEEAVAFLMLSGKSTLEKTGAMLAIMRDILLTVNLDNRERFKQMVLRSKAGRESSLVPSGHSYARQRLAARLSPAEWVDEQMGGIEGLFFIRELEQQIEQDWPTVLANLEHVRAHLVNRRGLLVNVTLDASNYQNVAPQLAAFVEQLPDADYSPAAWGVSAAGPAEGLTIPAKVNYVAKGANLYQHGLRPNGSASVVVKLLNTAWLWDKVRVQGGAYGGFCGFNRNNGVFTYTSYRDPNLLATLDIYDRTGDFLRNLALDQTGLERAIIGTISDVDSYQLPDAKGGTAMWRYILGANDAYRQQLREEILDTSPADIRAFADAVDAVREHGIITVVGSADAVEAANREQPGLLMPVRVL
ncbi:peptidase M16C associated domain-containing protein [Oscillochloris trichoides DG-6]|uniref:Peptidase M16C associated domain-containing protein n=1 Tax=Oscillochloris trichoides DG-6 TaxID=765420 RepID=E1IF99_9CHLR|nr:insulinase family protein [Oscillochloris trichoides]EFO80139.1 peptidase M16C associated domain-containing protein [Oscillochloris trichoides DG-6]